MRSENWFDVALKIIGIISLFSGVFIWVRGMGRKQASVTISKTEGEVYKNLVENKLADLNLSELIDTKVELAIKEFKDMLWEAQQEHFKIKLDMQEKLNRSLKEKNEILQENELLKNELVEIREEHQTCLRQIAGLRKEVDELRQQQS